MHNLEIKVPLADRAATEVLLRALGAALEWTRSQRDTFFAVPAGWLKLREEGGSRVELIAYRRATDRAGPRRSEYQIAPAASPRDLERVLAGALGVEGVVRKERTLWRYGHTRIHLDRVEGLGEFLELETVVEGIAEEEAQGEIDRLIAALHLDRGAMIAVPYRDLQAARAP